MEEQVKKESADYEAPDVEITESDLDNINSGCLHIATVSPNVNVTAVASPSASTTVMTMPNANTSVNANVAATLFDADKK